MIRTKRGTAGPAGLRRYLVIVYPGRMGWVNCWPGWAGKQTLLPLIIRSRRWVVPNVSHDFPTAVCVFPGVADFLRRMSSDERLNSHEFGYGHTNSATGNCQTDVAASIKVCSVNSPRANSPVRRPSHRTRIRSQTAISSGSSLDVMIMARPSAHSWSIRR